MYQNAFDAIENVNVSRIQFSSRQSGSLITLIQDLIIKSRACNLALYRDIHYLAKSQCDNILGLPYALLTSFDARRLTEHLKIKPFQNFWNCAQGEMISLNISLP